MEFLRDEDINKVDTLTETSEDKTIIDSGAETESRLGDPAVELETPEAWPDHQGRDIKEKSGKELRWLHTIGENREYFSRYHNQIDSFNYNFREEGFALCCSPCRCDLWHCCSNFLFSVNSNRCDIDVLFAPSKQCQC